MNEYEFAVVKRGKYKDCEVCILGQTDNGWAVCELPMTSLAIGDVIGVRVEDLEFEHIPVVTAEEV